MIFHYCCVIVTYNRLSLLKECIDAVQNQVKKFTDVVIVNNNSSDGTTEYLNETYKDDSSFHIINLDVNSGGAGGFYEGLKNIPQNDDWVLLIDDDAILRKDFLLEIDKGLNDNYDENIQAYSGTVVLNNFIDITHRKLLKNKITLKTKFLRLNEYDKKYSYIDLASFCGLLISAQLIKKIGLPEKEFFIWYDDTEYSLRIRKYSKIININSAKLDHKTKPIIKSYILSWKSYYGYRNYIVSGIRHSSNKNLFRVYVVLKFTILNIYNFMKSIIDKKNGCSYLKKIKMRKEALYDGLKQKLGKNSKYLPSIELL